MSDRFVLARQLLIIAAIAIALYAQHTVHGYPYAVGGWLMFVAAALVMMIAAWPMPAASGPVRETPCMPAPVLRLVLMMGAAVLAIGLTTALSLNRKWPVLTIVLWLAGFLFASFGVRSWVLSPPAEHREPWTKRELLFLVAILLLAGLARTLWIDSLPRTYFGDEPRVAMYLHNTYSGGRIPNFFSMGWNTWPVVGLSLQGLFVPFCGLHMSTLRLSSALIGTLAVLATYLLARELFTARVALLGALLFAACRTAIDFSRLGVTHAQVLFIQTLAFYFCWRAVNTGRAIHYLWAGIALGLCLYTYNAGQLAPPLLLGWVVLSALRSPRFLGTHWRGVVITLAGFLLALTPYLFFFTDVFTFGPNWDQWTIMARNRQTGSQIAAAWQAGGLSPAAHILWHQVSKTWLGFGVLPGAGYPLGYRGGGILDEVTAALFVLGLAVCVPRLLRGRHAFLPYWVLVTMIAGGILTINPPAVVRMVGFLPALAILAALPLDWLIRMSSGAVVRRGIGLVLAASLICGAVWDNWRTYFVDFAGETADYLSELARFVASLPEEYHAVLLGTDHFLVFHGELFLIEFPRRLRDIPEPAHFFPIHQPVDSPLAVVLGPTQTTLTEYARTLYPDLEVTDVINNRSQQTMFRALLLTPEQVQRRAGLELTAYSRNGAASSPRVADPFSPEPETGAGAERLLWTGSLYWPSTRPITLTVETTVPTRLRLAGMTIMEPDGRQSVERSVQLPRGWHPLVIDERLDGPRQLSMGMRDGKGWPLTRWDFRPESTSEGLQATYRRDGELLAQVIDPQLNAFAVEDRFHGPELPIVRMPFTASWRSALRIDTPGSYQLEAIGSGPYSVRLDDQPLFDVTEVVPEVPVTSRTTRALSIGLHTVAVEWDSTRPAHTTRRLFQLFWTPPGGKRELIPPTNFARPTSE